jgi:membrane protein YdbS with pleckstrin-like domain
MNDQGLINDACKWCYRGVWGVLTEYFCLPVGPPHLPSMEGEMVINMRPSLGYLNYRKFLFWIGLFTIDIILSCLWIGFIFWWPFGGLITAPLWLIVIIGPDILAYIAIHLRYDTTWYVLTDRSMRIRRGIWSIYETTITFENIQNIHVSQGPLQRWFGFANLTVVTAGGGGGAGHEGHMIGSHVGILEGLDNASELRERILSRCQSCSGLGDESLFTKSAMGNSIATNHASSRGLQEHINLLREIREHTQILKSREENQCL